MVRFLIALALLACLSASCSTSATTQFVDQPVLQATDSREVSATNATNAWNSVCQQYNFIHKPLNTSITFAVGYYGSDFAADAQRITDHVNSILNAQPPSTGNDIMNAQPPSTGNDIMRTWIENWGSN